MDATGDAPTTAGTGETVAAGSADRGGHADPLPFAREARELVRPAAIALVAGALALLPVAVLAGNAAGLQALWVDAPADRVVAGADLVTRTEQVAATAGSVLYTIAAIASCVWLVRLQRVAARTGRLDRLHTDGGLWVMWVVPILGLVLPARRLARFDRVLHDARHASWVVHAWAVSWVAVSSSALWRGSRDQGEGTWVLPFVVRTPGLVVTAWVRLGVAVVGLALWAAVVVRLTVAGRRAEARTTALLRAQSSRSPSTSR